MPPGSGADLPPPREDREVDGTSGVSKNPRAERRADDEPRPNRQSARACAMRAAGVVAGRREGPASVRESTKGRAGGGGGVGGFGGGGGGLINDRNAQYSHSLLIYLMLLRTVCVC